MKNTLTAVAAAAIVAAATLVPDTAEARRGRGGAIAAGVIGGIAAGAIIAGAGRHYYGGYGYGPGYGYGGGYYAPAYYGGYGPGCVIRRERVWDGYGWRVQRVRVCY